MNKASGDMPVSTILNSDQAGARAMEDVFLALNAAIDAAPPEQESLLLAKVALLLAHELDDAPRALRAIEAARRDMTPEAAADN